MIIWVLGRRYPNSETIAGSFELDQARMLAKYGLNVYYPAINLRLSHLRRRLGFYCNIEGGVNVIHFDIPLPLKIMPNYIRRKIYLLFYKICFSKMRRYFGKPDVLHVHYPSIRSSELVKFVKGMGCVIIETEHYTKVQNKQISQKTIKNLKEHVSLSDAFICVGELLRDSVIELTGTDKPIKVVPNIVPDYFYYHKERFIKDDGQFRIIGVGRLVACKRFDLLIKAFIRAFRDQNNVSLSIIGDGEEKSSLEELIEKSSCNERIRLIGAKGRFETAEYMSGCHTLVLSSNLETFGVPVIEAMACGMPVITSDSLGFLSYINSDNGIVFRTDDEDDLVLALQSMYQNYSQYNRERIALFAKENFGENTIYNMLYDIYHQALNSRH